MSELERVDQRQPTPPTLPPEPKKGFSLFKFIKDIFKPLAQWRPIKNFESWRKEKNITKFSEIIRDIPELFDRIFSTGVKKEKPAKIEKPDKVEILYKVGQEAALRQYEETLNFALEKLFQLERNPKLSIDEKVDTAKSWIKAYEKVPEDIQDRPGVKESKQKVIEKFTSFYFESKAIQLADKIVKEGPKPDELENLLQEIGKQALNRQKELKLLLKTADDIFTAYGGKGNKSFAERVDEVLQPHNFEENELLKESNLYSYLPHKTNGYPFLAVKAKLAKRAALYKTRGLEQDVTPSLVRKEQLGYDPSTIRVIENAFKQATGTKESFAVQLLKGPLAIISERDVYVIEGKAGSGSYKVAQYATKYFSAKKPEERRKFVILALKEHEEVIAPEKEEKPVAYKRRKHVKKLQRLTPRQKPVETKPIIEKLEVEEKKQEASNAEEDYGSVIVYKDKNQELPKTTVEESPEEIRRRRGIGEEEKEAPIALTKDEEFRQEIEYMRKFQGEGIAKLLEVRTIGGKEVVITEAAGYRIEGANITLTTLDDAYELYKLQDMLPEMEAGNLEEDDIEHLNKMANQFVKTEEKKSYPLKEIKKLLKLNGKQQKQIRKMLLQGLQDTLVALNTVHTQGYVYNDLKWEQMLLNGRGKAELTDFGTVHELGKEEEDVGGSPEFFAPERVDSTYLSDSSADVYSFGIMLYQLMRKQPHPLYEEIKNYNGQVKIEHIHQKVTTAKEASLLDFDEKIKSLKLSEEAKNFYDLARDCLKLDPTKRPTIKEIQDRLTHLIPKY